MLPSLYRYITSGGCLASGRPPFPNTFLAQPRIHGSCSLTRNPQHRRRTGAQCHPAPHDPGDPSGTKPTMIPISGRLDQWPMVQKETLLSARILFAPAILAGGFNQIRQKLKGTNPVIRISSGLIFAVQPSKFCLVIFGANFARLFVLYQGGGQTWGEV